MNENHERLHNLLDRLIETDEDPYSVAMLFASRAIAAGRNNSGRMSDHEFRILSKVYNVLHELDSDLWG